MNFLPNSRHTLDVENIIHPYTNLHKHKTKGPMIITKGKGVYVYDDNGKEYIEGMAGLWCTALGFGEKELIDAATEQLNVLPYYHQFTHKSTDPSIQLSEKLKNIAPFKASKVFFASSGSEANDTQVKLMWYINNAKGLHKKKKILSHMKGYHGVTVAAASMTGLPANHLDFDLPIKNMGHISTPHYYRNSIDGETEQEFSSRLARELEERIIKEGPETVAAFIAEPVMGAGGVIIPPKDYYEKIQSVLNKYEIMFIADEVICGFGRTGNMWGSQTMNINPHSLSCAKQLSSAYLPISAVMVNDEISELLFDQSKKIGTFGHGYTYSAHPVCAAVALKNLELFEERSILENINKVSPYFQKRLQKLKGHELIGEARCIGLIGALEIVSDKKSKKPFDLKQLVGFQCMEFANKHGLIIRAIGDNIAFCPPLIINETQIGDIFDKIELALDDTAHWINKNKLREQL